MSLRYYRPLWACGRYNAVKRVALLYNLVEGMSYFFEDYSALVIGEVLSMPRSRLFTIESIADRTGIAMESILDFFTLLEEKSLLRSVNVSEDILDYVDSEFDDKYRRTVGENRRNETQTIERTTQEKLPFARSNAEMDYSEASGGVCSVMFELTYNCSERCIHCYNPGATRNDSERSRRADRIELQLNDYKRIIDELYELGLVRVCLSGGEAFTKPCIWELIEYLWEKEIVFDVFTNGILLDAEKIARLVKYYPRVVGISIYSGVASEHDLITRVSGSWERSMNAIKLLSEYGVLMHLKCCVMRPNVRNYYKVAEIAKEYGATPQFEISITDSVEGDMCASENLRLPPEMLEIVLRDDNVPLYVGKEAPNFGGQAKTMDKNPCGAGENSFCITPEGNVQICVAFPMVLGNLKTQTMSEIISESVELKYWLSTKLSDYEECGRYDYCAYCNLCPGINYSTHGSHLKAALSTCDIAKTRFNLAQKMMKSGYDPLSGKTLKECSSVLDNSIPSLKRVFAPCVGGSESGKRINEVS